MQQQPITDEQLSELKPLANLIADKVSTVPVRHCLGGTDQLVTELVLAVSAYMGRILGPDARVLAEVQAERERQDARWGEQNHPDGTGRPFSRHAANTARANCQAAAEAGEVTWKLISDEEHAEAMAESDPVKLRAELIQDAAVKVAWVAAIDRRIADDWERGEETHVVADDSDDPEHIDDCPGCAPAPAVAVPGGEQ